MTTNYSNSQLVWCFVATYSVSKDSASKSREKLTWIRRAKDWRHILDDISSAVFHKMASLHKNGLINTILNNFSNTLGYEVVILFAKWGVILTRF